MALARVVRSMSSSTLPSSSGLMSDQRLSAICCDCCVDCSGRKISGALVAVNLEGGSEENWVISQPTGSPFATSIGKP